MRYIFCNVLLEFIFLKFLNQDIWLTLGCHPSDVHQYDDMADYYLDLAMKHDKVVALGEIGLDDSWANNNDNDFIQQQKVPYSIFLATIVL